MQQIQINIWAALETKLHWMHKTSNIFQQRGKQCLGTFKAVGPLSNEGALGTTQPGGVGLFLQGNVVGRTVTTGTDSRGLGRWSYIVLNGQYNKKIWVIAGYRVPQVTTAGDQTAYLQKNDC
eukprot:14248166-Ditylum_brightwellii.AAC.1